MQQNLVTEADRALVERLLPLLMQRIYPTIYDSAFTQFEPTDHFRDPTLSSAWSWAGYLSGTPLVASLSFFPGHLVLGHNVNGARFFLSRAISGSNYQARVLPQLNQAVGLRLDDGTDNNYAEFYINDSATTGKARLDAVTRTGGGAVAGTILVDNLSQGPICLRAVPGGSQLFCYWSREAHLVDGNVHFMRFCGNVACAASFTRCGIVLRNSHASDGPDRRSAVDWFHIT
jgi:hypothetical protein